MFLRKRKVSPLVLIAGASFVIAFVFTLYPHNIFQNQKQTEVKGISVVNPTGGQTNTLAQSTPQQTITAQSQKETAPTVQPTLIPAPTSKPIATPTTLAQAEPIATPTLTPKPTQAPVQTVTIQLIEPDGTSNFTVNLNSGNTLCDNLTEAKSEGKIKSVTLDYSYMSSFHSPYVREINGYQNNWTVTVDGTSPQGCAFYSPKAGDNITWKFG